MNTASLKGVLAQFLTPHAVATIADIAAAKDKSWSEGAALKMRILESGQLVNEMRIHFGEEAANYVTAHLSQQVEECFGTAKVGTAEFNTATAKFLKTDLWKQVATCAHAIDKNKPPAESAVRQEFLGLGEDTVDAVLGRVKEYQLHWEGKQLLNTQVTAVARENKLEEQGVRKGVE